MLFCTKIKLIVMLAKMQPCGTYGGLKKKIKNYGTMKTLGNRNDSLRPLPNISQCP